MLTPTKVTINIREATTTLISKNGIHRTGEPFVIEFESENHTFAVMRAIVWLEAVECPSEKFEWALIRWAMCDWLRRRANSQDAFGNMFSYASSKLWMIHISIKEIQCHSQQPMLPPISQPTATNTKSFVQRGLAYLKTVLRF